MRRRIVFPKASLLAVSLLIGAGAPPSHAQPRPAPGAIDGVVTDTNLVSLAGATVSVLGSEIQVVTGANGRFRILTIPAGQYIVVARRVGHEPVSSMVRVSAADTLRLSFALERIAGTLDTVVVAANCQSARFADFDARSKLGLGQFMNQAEIEKRAKVFVTELIRTFQSVRVVAPGGGTRYFAASAREPIGRPPCLLAMLVDGLPYEGDLDNLPSPREIGGIEVYAGPATIPLQYKRTAPGNKCGLIMFWTRDGSQEPQNRGTSGRAQRRGRLHHGKIPLRPLVVRAVVQLHRIPEQPRHEVAAAPPVADEAVRDDRVARGHAFAPER